MPCLSRRSIEVLHQVADGEVRRVALAAVAELLAELERVVVRHVEREDLVAEAARARPAMNRSCAIVRPHDEDRGVLALLARELARDRVEPVLGVLDGGRGACAPRLSNCLSSASIASSDIGVEVASVLVVRRAHGRCSWPSGSSADAACRSDVLSARRRASAFGLACASSAARHTRDLLGERRRSARVELVVGAADGRELRLQLRHQLELLLDRRARSSSTFLVA